jgi:ParB family chromosome partitioning protein
VAAKKKPTTTRAPARRKTPRKAPAGSRGLEARACVPEGAIADLDPLRAHVEKEGGCIVGAYKDPFGGHSLMLAVVPIDRVAPTPFQRDLSDTHHKRLAEVIEKTGRFLDPIVAITAPPNGEVGFWTPNGRHRLEAMRRLGARAITVLLVPDRTVAWQILALNTEKAHNLKERALEVIRIYRGLLDEDDSRTETGFSFYLEDPALVTLGVCYERNGRFAGGAYHPVLRRCDKFHDAPLKQAIKEHERAAELTLEVEAAVGSVIEKLRAKGLTSPYLRSFVVSRINPLRWIQGEIPPLEKVLGTMRERATKFNTEKVRQEDLVRAGGAPDEEAS